MTATDSIFSGQFWRTTLELAVRGAGIGAAGAMGGSLVDAWHLPWKVIAGMAVSGALLSVATSLGAISVGPKGSPLVTAPVPPKTTEA